MTVRSAPAFFAALALCACTHAPAGPSPASNPAKENPAMTTPAATGSAGQGAAPVQPRLDAEQVLTRLLELIRSSESIKDFTPAYLSKAMGVEFATYRPGYHAFGEQVTPVWWYSLEMHDDLKASGIEGPRFDFSFGSAPGADPDMTEICQVDFERFKAELESIGFASAPYYVEHGRLMSVGFTRPGLSVEVYPRGEANDPIEKISHKCVWMIQIR